MKKIRVFYLSAVILFFSASSVVFAYTNWVVNSGIWNSTYTWYGSSIPTMSDSVYIDPGYTVYIDTNAECKALSITVGSFANLIFTPDGVTGSTLTVYGDLEINENAVVQMDSTHANDILKLSADDIFFYGESADFTSTLEGNNSRLTVLLSGVINLGYIDATDGKNFTVTANAPSNIDISCTHISMETYFTNARWNYFSIDINSPNVKFYLDTNDIWLERQSSFSIDIDAAATTSSATIRASEITVPANTIFDLRCLALSSTMTLTLNGESFVDSNGGNVYLLGANPSANPKPDSRDTRRNLIVNGVYNASYMYFSGYINMQHAAINRIGKWRTPDKYGICLKNFDGSLGLNSIMYNCDISSSVDTGIYVANCNRLNDQWYNQGISSCVVRDCVYNGIWFDSVNKSIIQGCQVYSINEGGNVGFGIRLNNSNQDTIKNCNVYDNKLIGVYLESSNRNLIFNNNVHDQSPSYGQEGIYLYSSSSNTITINRCYSNPVHGIGLEYNSTNNYLVANQFFNNATGGMRVRYEAVGNIFLANISTGNAKTALTSHSSIGTLCANEIYGNNGWGDIYVEGEFNQGYVSQLWLRDCLLNSTTEITNTPEKQEFTKANSWIISTKHDNVNGLTHVWGQFSMPQAAHTWHTTNTLKFNYADATLNSYAHGWNATLNANDTALLRYDDGGLDGPGFPSNGTSDISSINTSSSTQTELWIVTYNADLNRWKVWSSSHGYHANIVIPDTDYRSDCGEVRFRITHHASGPSPAEEYIFATLAASNDTNCQKVVKLSDFSDTNYIGASFTNYSGGNLEMVGTPNAPTVITNKHAEDKAYSATNEFYYGLDWGGTINRIAFTSFTYINANGLTLNSAPLVNTTTIFIDCLQRDTTYSAYITANNITHTFDNITLKLTTGPAYGVRTNNSTLAFRDYTRPFLPDLLNNSYLFWDPTIIYTGQSGFTNDGVEPDTINRNESLEFQVKYTDLNNNPPTTVQVWIDLDDDLIYSTTEQIGMTLKPGVNNDGNYINGEIYHYIRYNLPYPPVPSVGRSGGKIKFRFYSENPYSVTISSYLTYNLHSVYNSVISTREATGIGTSSETFTIKGIPPRCLITTPSTKQTGLVTINYLLVDDDDKPDPYNYCDILVEYRDGEVWKPATRFVGSEPLVNLKSSYGTGTPHVFIWDTTTDLAHRNLSAAIRITATDEDGTASPATTGSFWVDNIVATKFVFITSEQNLEAGTTSGILYIEAQDDTNNRDTDVYGIIEATSTSGSFNFVNSTANIKINNLNIVAGRSEFKYCDSVAGFPTITISSSGLQNASQIWTISNPVNASTSTITVDSLTSYVAGSTVTVTVTLYDISKQPVQNKTVNIFVSGTNNSIKQPLDKSNVDGKVYASFNSTRAEDKNITAFVVENNLLLASSVTVTFIPTTVDANSSLVEISTPIASVGSTVTVTVTLLDRYQNRVPNRNIGLTMSPLRATDIIRSTMATNSDGVAYAYIYSETHETKSISVTVQPPPSFTVLTQTISVLFKIVDISPPVASNPNPSADRSLSAHFDNVSVDVHDTGGSGVNITSTTVKLYYFDLGDQNWDESAGITTYAALSVDDVTFSLSFQTMVNNGTYRIVCTPYDNANNPGAQFVSEFLLYVVTEVPEIRSTQLATSGNWNDESTWEPQQVPTTKEKVILRDGFTVVIDTVAPCTASELEIGDSAVVVFSSGSGQSASLTVDNDIIFSVSSRLDMKTNRPVGDIMSLTARDLKMNASGSDSDSININAAGDQSNISLNIRDWLTDTDKNSSFNITATTRCNISVNCRDVNIRDYNNFNVTVSSYANLAVTFTGIGAHGKMTLNNNAGFNLSIDGATSNVLINIDDILVNSYSHLDLFNNVNTSTLTLTINSLKVENYGKVSVIGVDPAPGSLKPDRSNTRRNIKVNAAAASGGYILVSGDYAGARFYHTEFYGFGRLPVSGEAETYGITFTDNSDFKVYNCNVWYGCVGLKIKNHVKESASNNNTWSGILNTWELGISSNIVHENSTYGIWFENVQRNNIFNCFVSTTIEMGQAYRLDEETTMGVGIILENSNMNTIASCDVYGNMIQGVFLNESDLNLIENNYIHHQNSASGEEGLYLYNSNKNVILSNYCFNNPVHGIALEYDSSDNYLVQNHCYNNCNGGFRVRYNANNNKFVTNFSTNNVYIGVNPSGAGLNSHSSIGTLLVEELYQDNWLGDIYLEGEQNQGYISQIWMKNCLLNSSTEFTNTPQKQEFTNPDSWVISQKHEGINGLTRIWGNFVYPQATHLWHTPVLRWNYANQTYNGFSHGWNTTQTAYDTPGKLTDAGGKSQITSVTVGSSTKSELWMLTYKKENNRWAVRGTSSGKQPTDLIPDTDYSSSGCEIGLRISHAGGVPKDGESYVFITVAESKDGDTYGPCKKTVEFCDFSDLNYIGASLINNTGGTVEIIGSSVNTTVFRRNLAEDNNTSFYYRLSLGGTIEQIKNVDFKYLDVYGLRLNAKPIENTTNIRIENLMPNTTFASYITVNNVNEHYFDKVYIETSNVNGIHNVSANNSVVYFRDYTRPFLNDRLWASQIYWDPTFEWAGLAGYTEDGIEPNHAERLASREFIVSYFDRGLASNGNAPTTVQVWVDLNDNGIYETGERFGMKRKPGAVNDSNYDGNFGNGEIYYCLVTTVDYAGDGRLAYRFYAENPYSLTVPTCTYNINSIYNSVITTNEVSGLPATLSTFTIRGTVPRISIDTPAGEQSSLVTITYRLIDSDNKPEPYNYCTVTVEYKDPLTGSWKEAKRSIGSEELKDLVAVNYPGAQHSFVWDSIADIPYMDVGTQVRITPKDEDGTGNPAITNTFQVDNIIATKLEFVTSAQELLTRTTSQVIKVRANDSAGNTDTDTNVTLTLFSNSTGYAFVSSTANIAVTQVNTVMGEATFKYRDDYRGNPTLIVSAPGLDPATQNWWITTNVNIYTSSITASSLSLDVGSSTVTNIYVTLRDVDSNPVPGKIVSIFVDDSSGVYITQPTGATNGQGEAIGCSIWATKAGIRTITAMDVTDNVNLVSSVTVTFNPLKPDSNISVVEVSSPVGMIGSTVTLTITLMDMFMNRVPDKNVFINPVGGSQVVLNSTPTTDAFGRAYATLLGVSPGTLVIYVTDTSDNLVLCSTVVVTFMTMSQFDKINPVVQGFTPANGSLITSQLTQVSVTIQDTGGSGVNFSSTTFTITKDGNTLTGTRTTNLNTITLTFPEGVLTNGSYSMTTAPADNANNLGTVVISSFTINIRSSEQVFKETVRSYPNPSNTGSVGIRYELLNTATKVTLKIYTIMGELVWEEQLPTSATPSGSPYDRLWYCTNNLAEKVGTGMYLIKITVEEGSQKYTITKKQIVVKQP